MFGRTGVIRIAAVVIGLAASILGLYLYGQSRYHAGKQAQQQAYALAELQAFRRESERLSGLSVELSERIATLAKIRPAIIERYTHEIRNTPLPDGCFIDAGRLQHINAAIHAANAAGKPVYTVPADTADQQ